ncbi:MAG: transglutaminase family protein [Burkholderiales bacterium]|nr:transglutaminase family protein [Burkholderiales bacterium]
MHASFIDRRSLLALAASAALPAQAQSRRFEPQPGAWREFELVTRIEVRQPRGSTRVWVPLPSVEADYQQVLGDSWTGTAAATRVATDGRYGARMLVAEFGAATVPPVVEVTSRVRTRSRAVDWSRKSPGPDSADSLRAWTLPTALMPTDGIVRQTALEASRGAAGDREKVQRIYDWVVRNTHREPKVRGCGVGDIKTMLETGNLSGKCGDINGLFVGLVRAAGLPARDVYGIRLVPSAFGYRELGGNSANLKGAQHCRAEVWLKDHGWVAMDPADVGKVMRLESSEWLKDPAHPLVAPVNKALFGGWEGNWLAYNTAHDVKLPGSDGPALGFLMYPQCENAAGRYDPLDPDGFQYTITARELKA